MSTAVIRSGAISQPANGSLTGGEPVSAMARPGGRHVPADSSALATMAMESSDLRYMARHPSPSRFLRSGEVAFGSRFDNEPTCAFSTLRAVEFNERFL